MSRILVCPEARAAEVAAEHAPSHVVALLTPDVGVPPPPGFAWSPSPASEGRTGSRSQILPRETGERDHAQHGGGGARTLRLVFNDIAEPRPGLVAPARADIAALIAFARSWEGARPLLVTCRMGISRSTAAALIVVLAARPSLAEAALATALRTAAPCATPNPLMIALADDLLGRGGLLVAAARAIGRGADYAPYRVAVLDLDAVA